jgi:hypothetical protein
MSKIQHFHLYAVHYRDLISSDLSVTWSWYPRSGFSMWCVSKAVLHGAGGMDMIDPLFQRILVRECRRRGIPVIFDEVLSGCWRFGVEVCALSYFVLLQPLVSSSGHKTQLLLFFVGLSFAHINH